MKFYGYFRFFFTADKLQLQINNTTLSYNNKLKLSNSSLSIQLKRLSSISQRIVGVNTNVQVSKTRGLGQISPVFISLNCTRVHTLVTLSSIYYTDIQWKTRSSTRSLYISVRRGCIEYVSSRLACWYRPSSWPRSRWAMRTPGSRPAVGRRQIVADKSSKRGITSAHHRGPVRLFRPSLFLLAIASSLYRPSVSPRLVRFCFFFSPFPPAPSFPPFSIRCVIFEAQALLSSLYQASRRESRTMIYGLEPLSISSLYAKVEEERPGPSLRRPTWPIFRAGFA